MNSLSTNTLPVILVSAQDLNTAETLISELISNETAAGSSESAKSKFRIWHILNKYYRAEVLLYPVCDGEPPPPPDIMDLVEAHIICISDTEVNLVDCAEKRLLQNSKAEVCLLLLEAAQLPDELNSWARTHHYELVPLLETPPQDSDSDSENDSNEPFKESYGIDRVRNALQAHTWSGLVRLDLPAELASGFDGSGVSSDEENSGWEDESDDEVKWRELDEEDAVEHAEAFAAALGALRGAGARARAGAGDSDQQRRRRAERALAALCHALGTPLHSL